jgi:selenocysteine-specific elongation factor
MGFPATGQRVGEWVVDLQWWAERRHQMMTAVKSWAAEHDVAAGMPMETLRQQADLPTIELVPALLDGTGLDVRDGLIRRPDVSLPPRVHKAVRTLEEWLAAEPFRALEADELKELELGVQELAAAVRAGD